MRMLGAAVTIGWAVSAWAVQVGDTRESVLAELGTPQNKLAAGAREFLQYPDGRVVIIDGRVNELRGTFTKPPQPVPPLNAPTPESAPTAPAKPVASKPTAAPAARMPRTAQWYTDIAAAQAAAAKENKLILALFTGTDWCGPCQQFKAEVENDEQFAGIFSGSFIFFKSDWQRNTPQPEAVRDEVGRLKRKYWVQAYPTLLVLNAEGERLDKVEWTKVQGGSFKEAMIEAIDLSRKATKGGKKVSGSWSPF